MELEIKTKKENKLLERTEIEAIISFEGATPANKRVQEELAKKLKVDPNLILIKHIYGKFGLNKAEVLAYAYPNPESLKRIEVIKKPKKAAAPKAE